MKSLLHGFFLAAILLTATVSATVIYTFGAGTNTGSSHTVTVDGLNLTVSGYGTDYDGISNTGTAANINRHYRGWGIETDPADNRIGLNEALVFDWKPNRVSLLSGVAFEKGSAPSEMFDLYIDGILRLDDFQILPDNPGSNLVSLDFTGYALSGSLFAFVCQTPILGNDLTEGIRIQQLTVESVPEPSSLILISLGMLGLVLARRNNQT